MAGSPSWLISTWPMRAKMPPFTALFQTAGSFGSRRTPDTKSTRNLWSGSGATAVSSLRSRELPLSCFSRDLRLRYSPSAKRLTSYSAMS